MAITHVVSSAGNDGISATTTTLSFSITGASANDLFVCEIQINSGTITISSNTDSCTLQLGPTVNGSNNLETWIYTKLLVAGDISRGTIRFTASGLGRFIGVASIFTGVDQTTPIDVVGTALVTNSSASSGTTNTITTVTDNAVVWATYSPRVASATNQTPGTPSGYTSGALSATAFAASPNFSTRSTYKDAATAGTWGGDTSTYTGTASHSINNILAIRAAASTPNSDFFAFF